MTGTALKIDNASTADIIAAPGAGKRIVVYGYVMVSADTTTVTFKSGTTGITGAMSMVVGVPVVAPQTISEGVRQPWLVCATNEALNLTNGSSKQVSGHLVYDIETVS